MKIPGRLVIQADTPVRRWIWRAIGLCLVAAALYAMFELGRYSAGFDGLAAAAERAALEQQLLAADRAQRELRVQLAAARDEQQAEVAERTELARTIGELQAQVSRAELDLQFYRGIATPQGTPGVGVRAQQFEVQWRDAARNAFALKFTLNRSTRSEELVNGNVAVTIDGDKGGTPTSLDLQALSPDKAAQVPYSFRYYATLEIPLQLPEGFVARRVTLEIRPQRKGVSPYRQTFLWNPQTEP